MAQTLEFIEFVDTMLYIENFEIETVFVRKRLIILSTSLWDQIKSRAQESRIGTLIDQLLKEAAIEKNSFGEKYFN